jgi:hypothetical protein
VVAGKAGGEHERHVRRAEEALAGHERGGGVAACGCVEVGQPDQRMVARVVVVDPGLDAAHVADDRIGLHRV